MKFSASVIQGGGIVGLFPKTGASHCWLALTAALVKARPPLPRLSKLLHYLLTHGKDA